MNIKTSAHKVTRRLSKAGREAISKAQKARWAKKKKVMVPLVQVGTCDSEHFIIDAEGEPQEFHCKRDECINWNSVIQSSPRKIEIETNKVQTGQSAALSSKKSLYFHDVPPEFYRRTALRHTSGHTKYNDNPVPITMNLNWRIGLDDPLYVMDRLNHMFEHMINFLESGNTKDDNLGAISWCCAFLMECERLHPEVFKKIWGQCSLSGKEAEKMKNLLQGQKK